MKIVHLYKLIDCADTMVLCPDVYYFCPQKSDTAMGYYEEVSECNCGCCCSGCDGAEGCKERDTCNDCANAKECEGPKAAERSKIVWFGRGREIPAYLLDCSIKEIKPEIKHHGPSKRGYDVPIIAIYINEIV